MIIPVVIFVISALYITAWLIHLRFAQPNARFHLPYHPSRILKINFVALSHLALVISYFPLLITHFVWRYWKTGPSGAREGVRRNIPYCKDGHRDHTYDLYLPVSVQSNNSGLLARVPIVVFIYGGSWSTGSKSFYGLLANMLRHMGYIVVVPDYRKYPEVVIDGIYNDVRQVLEVVGQEGNSWGGDVNRVFVIGHSAGAQIAAQVAFSAVMKEARMRAASEVGAAVVSNGRVNGVHHNGFGHGHGPKMPNIQGLVLMAGVYDVAAHYDFETYRGVEDISAMGRCMGGFRKSFDANSPKYLLPLPQNATAAKPLEGAEGSSTEDEMLTEATSRYLAELMPRVMLVHGERDTTVPASSTIDFYKALGNAILEEDRDTVDVRVRLYKRMGHSEVVTALMSNLFFRNRSTGSLTRDLKEFIEPEIFENSDDYI